MNEVVTGLYVGDDRACDQATGDEWRVVHACKDPCHMDAVGYSGTLPQDHPEYLTARDDSDLYLNLSEMERELSQEFTKPIITAALDFIEEYHGKQPVLVHSNEGRSRSPALVLLYLAKRAGEVPDASYDEAREEFQDLYPKFLPEFGVGTYLQNYWSELE